MTELTNSSRGAVKTGTEGEYFVATEEKLHILSVSNPQVDVLNGQ